MTEATSTTPKAKTPVETILMKDGRKVDFAGKKKMLKEIVIEGDRVGVRFDFRNGETLMAWVPEQHRTYCAGHGYGQKLGDDVAGETDVDDMFIGVSELHDRLQDGPWAMKREGTGFGGASILVKALCEHTGKAVEEIKTFLKKQVDGGETYPRLTAAFEKHPAVGPIIKRLKEERDAKGPKVDANAVLSALGV